MKLKCRCGEILTNDLYPRKRWELMEEIQNYGFKGNTRHYMRIRKGSFMYIQGFYYPEFLISPDDVFDQEQLEYKGYNGCCGNNHVEYSCPSCKAVVGYQYLDCYDDWHIAIVSSKVERVYK